MLSTFSGWHLLILLAVLLVIAAIVVAVVMIVRRSEGGAVRMRREADELRARAERAERDTDGLV